MGTIQFPVLNCPCLVAFVLRVPLTWNVLPHQPLIACSYPSSSAHSASPQVSALTSWHILNLWKDLDGLFMWQATWEYQEPLSVPPAVALGTQPRACNGEEDAEWIANPVSVTEAESSGSWWGSWDSAKKNQCPSVRKGDHKFGSVLWTILNWTRHGDSRQKQAQQGKAGGMSERTLNTAIFSQALWEVGCSKWLPPRVPETADQRDSADFIIYPEVLSMSSSPPPSWDLFH